MSSSTSSRSTLTMVPSTMSPSLKYLIVLSIAARKSSDEPMSLTATCGVVVTGASVVDVIEWVDPDRESYGCKQARIAEKSRAAYSMSRPQTCPHLNGTRRQSFREIPASKRHREDLHWQDGSVYQAHGRPPAATLPPRGLESPPAAPNVHGGPRRAGG